MFRDQIFGCWAKFWKTTLVLMTWESCTGNQVFLKPK